MTEQLNGSWTLFEFVGGPRDGELAASSPSELGTATRNYLLRSNPIHAADSQSWEDAADRAATAFQRGTPGGYARLLWEGDTFSVSAYDPADLEARIASQRVRIEHALTNGEHHEARLIASAFYAHTPSSTALIESLLAPAIRSIGERWAAGELRIYVEQRASAIVHSILGGHSAASAQVAGQRVVVATVAGESHSLPARMAAVALREDGWQVEEMHGAVPTMELIESAIERRLDLVVISATINSARSAAQEVQRQLEPHKIPVLIGQPGQSLSELQRMARRISLAALAH